MHRIALLPLAVSLAAVPAARADGMLDPSFGNGGLVTTAFPGPFAYDAALSLVMLPDGRAVAAGYTNLNLAYTEMAVARYLTTGALDTTFHGDGLVTVPFYLPPPATDAYSEAPAVLLQPDGRLVLVGGLAASGQNFIALARARLLPNGLLDTSFGAAGFLRTDFAGGPDECHAVAIAGPDRILTAGRAGLQFQNDFALARYIATTPVELLGFEVE